MQIIISDQLNLSPQLFCYKKYILHNAVIKGQQMIVYS